ncbi:hypothetical protein Pan97_52540 [Bremerella volcania]|uniref:Uncharacterized protein n=1 Tax=Bremerella volcania TaxID=2527984 RepID=A0A518CG27_9BACT|nr:hypothetical protein [Bremerella volcania]QDU78171.1 hypothetical protein Pan97_52540 [Bremerella volcania]
MPERQEESLLSTVVREKLPNAQLSDGVDLRTLASLLVVALSGCQIVHFSEIPGERWSAERTNEMRGWWSSAQGDVYQAATRFDGGLLIGTLSRRSEDKFEAMSNVGTFSSLGEHDFIFFETKTRNRDEPTYGFLLVKNISDDKLVLIPPNGPRFAEMIDKSQLAGKTVHYENSTEYIALVTSKSDAFKEVLKSNKTEDLFDFNQKLELSRIKLPKK